MRKAIGFIAASIALAGLLASCGGGGGSAGNSGSSGGGSTATPLTVAEKVSVVDAQEGGGTSSPARGAVRAPVPQVPADSDYFNDPAHVYVEEQSIQSFNSVNEILCMVAQTRYDSMLNEGPYKAQIDRNQCKPKGDASAGGQQSSNQSSGANMPDYAMWTVDVTRTDDSSPQVVKVWAHEPASDNEPEKVIYAKAVVTEGVSATNPYGLFTINFDGHPVVGGVTSPQSMFKGTLKTELSNGKVLLKFFQTQNFDGNTSTEAATLDRGADGSSGGGTLRSQMPSPTGPITRTIDIAYNSSNFYRVNQAAGKEACLSRTQFDESAWRYGVYDSAGARVERNSGFPVRFSQGGQDLHGYIGYFGAWFPGNVTLSTGDSVYRQSYGEGNAEVRYEILAAEGKLRKHARRLLTLGDIAGIPLDYMEWSGTGNDNQYRVVWNGSVFTKVAQMNRTTWTWENLATPVDIDLSALRFSELNFYSQALSGDAQVKLANCTPGGMPPNVTFACTASDSTPVVSYSDVAVVPGESVPTTLACFENCPDAAQLSGPTPFLPFTGYQPVAPSAATYTPFSFDGANMVLKSGSTAVVALTVDNAFQFGLMSGPLFDPSSANLDLLRCPWDNNTCPWQARSNLPLYYTWETGPNNWNRLVALKEPVLSTFVSFDPPLVLDYVHTGNGFVNAKFSLQYDGFGNLNGIPGKCVNVETGLDADCSQGGPNSPIRWVPEFTISDGSVLSSGGATYYAKALEKEQRMMKVSLGTCASLLPATSYAGQLPGVSDWTDPAVGSEPSVTGAPAVIGGILQ